VSASSELGIDGNIDLKPDTNISGSLAVLPDSFLDESQQLSERCVARSGNNLNSFVVKGRGGVPLSPGNLVPSDFKDYLKPKDYSLQNKISEGILYHRSLENNKTSSHLGLGGNYQYASRDIDCIQY
jgi:large exoprotein involved in heme utilization and adhesion